MQLSLKMIRTIPHSSTTRFLQKAVSKITVLVPLIFLVSLNQFLLSHSIWPIMEITLRITESSRSINSFLTPPSNGDHNITIERNVDLRKCYTRININTRVSTYWTNPLSSTLIIELFTRISLGAHNSHGSVPDKHYVEAFINYCFARLSLLCCDAAHRVIVPRWDPISVRVFRGGGLWPHPSTSSHKWHPASTNTFYED